MEMVNLLSDFGFPILICLILLYAIRKAAAALMILVVEPVVSSHKRFLLKMEEQLEIQSECLTRIGELQKQILEKVAS